MYLFSVYIITKSAVISVYLYIFHNLCVSMSHIFKNGTDVGQKLCSLKSVCSQMYLCTISGFSILYVYTDRW